MIARFAPGTAASIRDLICSKDSTESSEVRESLEIESSDFPSSLDFRRMKDIWIGRRLQVVSAKGRHGELAGLVRIEMRGLVVARKLLSVDFSLQFHKSMEQRLRPGRTTGNVYIDWNITVYAFQNVITLFERPAGNGASAHGNDVFRIGHLVVEPHNLWRHFLGHRAGHDHQIGLARRGPENFAAEPGQVVA